MKKTKVIQNTTFKGKFNHEFDLDHYKNKAGNEVYTLSYSTSSVWNEWVKGKRILTLVDTGNGLKFKFSEKTELRNLQYNQANYIAILLKYVNKLQKIQTKTRFK